MDASLIGWILTAVVVIMIVYCVLMGAKRGLGKTLFRLIWLLVFAVGLFFLTPVISNALSGLDISFLNLDINGPINTIGDIGANILNSLAESNEVLASSTALKELASALPVMIISIPLYVLLFFITKWLLWPVWAIIASKIFNKQKRAQKKFKKEQKRLAKENGTNPEEMPLELTVNKKKNRLGGAVLGLVMGLAMSIITFMPLVGVNEIYQNIASIKVNDENGKQVSLIESQIDNPEVLEYFSVFEDSVASKLFTYTGVEFVSNAMFSYLTTAEVNSERISLSNEVNTVAKIYDNVVTLMNIDNGELTQTKLDKTLTAVKEILEKVKDSNLINVLGDDIIPLVINDYLEQEDLYIIDGGDFDQLIKDSYSAYSRRFNTKDLENQIGNLVDVALTLNNSNIIVPLINGEVSTLNDVFTLVGNNVVTPHNFTSTIVNKLYEVNMLSNSYPQLVENAIKSLYEKLDLTYNTQVISQDTLKTSLESLLTNFIDFARYYSKSVDLDFGANTYKAFESLGGTIDVLKNILEKNNYTNLLNYAIDNINEAIITAGDFTGNSVDHINKITKSLSQVESWKDELNRLNTLYSKVIRLVNSNASIEELLSDDYTVLEEIGEGITSAMRDYGSKVITNQNIRRILEVLLKKVEETGSQTINEILGINVYNGYDTENQVPRGKTLKNTILDNIYIYEQGGNGFITDRGWTNEFRYNVAVIKRAYKVVTNEISTEELTTSNNTVLQDIGASIDNAILNARLIFSNASMRGIIEYYLNKMEAEGTIPDRANEVLNISYNGSTTITIKNQILTNIYDPSGLNTIIVNSWESEFVKIKSLLDTKKFETEELSEFGGILDNVLYSNIFSRDVINSVVIYYIDDQVSKNNLTHLSNGITEMKSNLNNVTSFKDEFKILTNIINTVTKQVNPDDPNAYDNDDDKFSSIGAEFNNAYIVNKSKMLTKKVLNSFMEYYFNEYVSSALVGKDEGLRNCVNEILNNLDAIENYQTEIRYILNFAKSVRDNTGDELKLANIGETLDTMSSSKLINTQVIRNLINYFIDEGTKSLGENNGLTDIITNLKDRVANLDVSVNLYKIEFAHMQDLTNVLSASELDYTNVGKTLDKIRNLNNSQTIASILISQDIVNQFINYYFDDFIATNLDASNDSDLITIVEKIKENVPNIAVRENNGSYQKELINLKNMFDVVNSNNNEEIGEALDNINNGRSTLITRENINEIVLYYFDKNTTEYASNDEYKNCLTSMRANLQAMKDTGSYSQMFADLKVITTTFNSLSAIESFDNFTTSSSNEIGEALDRMERMNTISNPSLAYDVANIVINKLKGFAEKQEQENPTLGTKLTDAINNVLEDSGKVEGTDTFYNYNFGTYKIDNYVRPDFINAAGEKNYYTSLLTDIFTSINS